MDIIGSRKYVEIPGDRRHELPPLLVSAPVKPSRLDQVMDMAAGVVDAEDLLADGLFPESEFDRERRRLDLAVTLVDQYFALLTQWRWGDSILEWIRQCETTFDARLDLRHLLRADVWPHAGRCSFVTLLADKAVSPEAVTLEKAVGLRLAFRQPPPLDCCSDQFLFYLNGTVASSAYDAWSGMSPAPISSLPPERFSFQVHIM